MVYAAACRASPPHTWQQKVVAITAAVSHKDRGLLGLEALRQALRALGVTVIGGAPTLRGAHFEAQIVALLEQLAQAVGARSE